MARQVVPTIVCDLCSKVEQVHDVKDLPEGWVQAVIGCSNGKPNKGKIDLCGLICVEKWAKERRKALAENAGELKDCPYCERKVAAQGYATHVAACERQLEEQTAP